MCDARTLFARHGLRCTKQRLDIYALLANSKRHPTAEELFWEARDTSADLSLATVYNTLEAFCRHGLCRKLASAEGGARFDADLTEHLHITTSEGELRDVPPDLGARLLDAVPKDLLGEIEDRLGMSISRVNIELFAEPDTEDDPRLG